MEKLTNDEYNNLIVGLHSILDFPTEKVEIIDNIPTTEELSDSNKGYKGKLTIMFVDMRKSTELTDELKSQKMIKIYRLYLRLVVQAIRYSGGYTRQFAGDGVLAVFSDDEDGNVTKSSEKAIKAARKIVTYIDYVLNPLLQKNFDGLSISCGIGINTGEIILTKGGMRGLEGDDTKETESTIVWIGKSTNYASKYCDIAVGGEIFIDNNTFEELSDNSKWNKISKVKNGKVYEGYSLQNYYIDVSSINDDIEPIQATYDDERVIEKTLILEVENLLKKIMDESLELGVNNKVLQKKIENFKSNDKALKDNEKKLNRKIEENRHLVSEVLELKMKIILKDYTMKKQFFSDHHCKNIAIKDLGKDFWISKIESVIKTGRLIGKSELDVKKELDCYLINIYEVLGMWEEAYDALCIQAQFGSWLNASSFENVVVNSKHWTIIQDILHERINPGYAPAKKNDFLNCYNILNKLGYKHSSQ